MSKYYLFVDDSVSTGGVSSYWKMVENIYDKYIKIDEGCEVEIIMWGSDTINVSSTILRSYISNQQGRNGGTHPQCVANYIIEPKYNIHENIVLVTDGQVCSSDVQATDRLLSNYPINNVICYIIGPSSSMNLSVTCPFTRENTSNIYINEKWQMSHTKSDFEQLKVIDSISYEDFVAKYDQIESMLIAMNMGREANLDMHSRLAKMKKKLVKAVADIVQSRESTKSNVTLLLERLPHLRF
jgi:hypothetical protein